MNKAIVATLIALITIVGGVMALNSGNVSTAEFVTYKEAQVQADVKVDRRLERMEEKIDVLLQRSK